MLKPSREVALFAAGGALGLLVDAVVVQVLANFPGLRRRPSLAVAAGSAIAALVNFSTARGMLSKRSGTVT
jgi:putative flippase GtrA